MLIGVPKEIKAQEARVGLTPASVRQLCLQGHELWVETQAGAGIACFDEAYRAAGAKIVADPKAIFDKAELIVKVKEPQPEECVLLSRGQTLFTYLHLAPDRRQTELLLKSGVTAIAYETVTDAEGRLPLLRPMSQVAGRMAIQAGAHALEKQSGGRGILLGGVPGVPSAQILILGGGVAGQNALRMAVGMEADVTVVDISLNVLESLDFAYGAKINTLFATQHTIEEKAARADLVIGAVLLPGAQAPKLLSKDFIRSMRPGSVLLDLAIDQGGCFETSRPTTHQDPTYVLEGIVHYCVANMPGAVPRTSTFALNNATLPFVMKLANLGLKAALEADPHLRAGLNIHEGKVTYQAVAQALDLPYFGGF